MNLQEHYTNMWNNALQHFERNAFEYDFLIDSVKDYRFGVTLVAKPSTETQHEIAKMLCDLQLSEPEQYYYPLADFHITILSIISCYDGFKLSNIDINAYTNVIRKSLRNIRSFPIMFEGITASPACIIIQGFAGDEIEKLRNNLRDNFRNTSLETSIDKRYQIHTAHSTVVRFRHALKDRYTFIEKIKRYRNFYFGTTEVQELKFVFNDWYQRHLDEHELAKFELPLY